MRLMQIAMFAAAMTLLAGDAASASTACVDELIASPAAKAMATWETAPLRQQLQ